MPIPILILSDAPDCGTGLGRITRDLAKLLSTMPEFRVGTMGRGGIGSRHLPWAQYTFGEEYQWGEQLLPRVWSDFSDGTPGVIFTIWDASRLMWFGAPQYLESFSLDSLNTIKFLEEGNFKRWGYFPIDGAGVGNKLSVLSAESLSEYDRVLAYSKFGADTIENTIGIRPDFIPHGIDMDVFQPRDSKNLRKFLGLNEENILVGCVMTNQARKDWGVWAHTCRRLIDYNPNYRFWAHVDALERCWSIPALIADFGLGDYVRITTNNMPDIEFSYYYSACDVTFLPSLGEGFGYPLAESMACGTPVIHHDYAAGGEILPPEMLIATYLERLDTLHNIYRPTLYPEEFSAFINHIHEKRVSIDDCRSYVEHLDWKKLGYVWRKWFIDGISTI